MINFYFSFSWTLLQNDIPKIKWIKLYELKMQAHFVCVNQFNYW